MKRIVIATDGSDGARQALEQGFALASDAGADVSVVYVRRSPNSFMGAPYYQDVITEEARHAKSVMGRCQGPGHALRRRDGVRRP
jgi:nucleotide-binding universal stress UspA family protein